MGCCLVESNNIQYMVLSPSTSVCGSALCAGAVIGSHLNSSVLQIMLACPKSLFLATGLSDSDMTEINDIILEFERMSAILRDCPSNKAFFIWSSNPINQKRFAFTKETMPLAFLIDLYRPILDIVFKNNSKISLELLCGRLNLSTPLVPKLKNNGDQSSQTTSSIEASAVENKRKKSRQSTKLSEAANQKGQTKLSFLTSTAL